MTLSDLASFVCAKVNQTEAEDVAACKLFLARRYEMVWADQLWKDSLFEYTQALSLDYTAASTWLPNKRVLMLPTAIEYPVAVRTETRQLTPDSAERLYRMDYDTFNSSGNAQNFINLPRCVWDFDTVQPCWIHYGTISDYGFPITVRALADDGVTLVNYSVTATTDATVAINNLTRIDQINKSATIAAVQLRAGTNVTILETMLAADTSLPLRCRIQILGTLPDPTTMRVLGKRTCPVLSGDNDSPALTGVENCLLSFAQGDMLERSRQYGKAAAVMQEGIALLEQLKKTQTTQMAQNRRLMPADGYGSDYWVFGQPPLTF